MVACFVAAKPLKLPGEEWLYARTSWSRVVRLSNQQGSGSR